MKIEDNVKINLVGMTFISKAEITSTTFKTRRRPTVQLVRTDVADRQVLRADRVRRPLHADLAMPTEFIAQNGMEIHETTPVSVTGCKKARHAHEKASSREEREEEDEVTA